MHTLSDSLSGNPELFICSKEEINSYIRQRGLDLELSMQQWYDLIVSKFEDSTSFRDIDNVLKLIIPAIKMYNYMFSNHFNRFARNEFVIKRYQRIHLYYSAALLYKYFQSRNDSIRCIAQEAYNNAISSGFLYGSSTQMNYFDKYAAYVSENDPNYAIDFKNRVLEKQASHVVPRNYQRPYIFNRRKFRNLVDEVVSIPFEILPENIQNSSAGSHMSLNVQMAMFLRTQQAMKEEARELRAENRQLREAKSNLRMQVECMSLEVNSVQRDMRVVSEQFREVSAKLNNSAEGAILEALVRISKSANEQAFIHGFVERIKSKIKGLEILKHNEIFVQRGSEYTSFIQGISGIVSSAGISFALGVVSNELDSRAQRSHAMEANVANTNMSSSNYINNESTYYSFAVYFLCMFFPKINPMLNSINPNKMDKFIRYVVKSIFNYYKQPTGLTNHSEDSMNSRNLVSLVNDIILGKGACEPRKNKWAYQHKTLMFSYAFNTLKDPFIAKYVEQMKGCYHQNEQALHLFYQKLQGEVNTIFGHSSSENSSQTSTYESYDSGLTSASDMQRKHPVIEMSAIALNVSPISTPATQSSENSVSPLVLGSPSLSSFNPRYSTAGFPVRTTTASSSTSNRSNVSNRDRRVNNATNRLRTNPASPSRTTTASSSTSNTSNVSNRQRTNTSRSRVYIAPPSRTTTASSSTSNRSNVSNRDRRVNNATNRLRTNPASPSRTTTASSSTSNRSNVSNSSNPRGNNTTRLRRQNAPPTPPRVPSFLRTTLSSLDTTTGNSSTNRSNGSSGNRQRTNTNRVRTHDATPVPASRVLASVFRRGQLAQVANNNPGRQGNTNPRSPRNRT